MSIGRNVVNQVQKMVGLVASTKSMNQSFNEEHHGGQDRVKYHTLVLTTANQELLFAKQSQLPHTPEKRAEIVQQAQDYVTQCEGDLADAKAALATIVEKQKHVMARMRIAESVAKAVLGALGPEDEYLVHRHSRTVSPTWKTNFSGG